MLLVRECRVAKYTNEQSVITALFSSDYASDPQNKNFNIS